MSKKAPFWKQSLNKLDASLPAAVKQPLHIMVAVFTGTERSGWVNPELTTLLMRLSYDPRMRCSYVPIHAIHPVCAARNMAVEDFFLKSPCDMLVLFDNDVAPPQNCADAILSMPAEASIAVLPYWVWLPVEKHTMPCFGYWKDHQMMIPDPGTLKPGWQEMGAGGTGCMFIRRKVFTEGKLERPFFKIISESKRGQVVSEDIWFTGRAAEAGYPTWTNTDFHCNHFHTINLADVNVGQVMVIKKFHDAIAEKYGKMDVTLGSLIHELHPELEEAAKLANLGKIAEVSAEDKEAGMQIGKRGLLGEDVSNASQENAPANKLA